jgi:hypothetical protein
VLHRGWALTPAIPGQNEQALTVRRSSVQDMVISISYCVETKTKFVPGLCTTSMLIETQERKSTVPKHDCLYIGTVLTFGRKS